MSTVLKKIKGRYELLNNKPKAEYNKIKLEVCRFWGGTKKGSMIQLTLLGGDSLYIQLTKKQVKKLINTLIDYETK